AAAASGAAATGTASAAAAATAVSDVVDGDGAETSCDERTEPFTGIPGTARERSFFAIKPDGLQRGLVGEVMTRFERKGWKLVGLKMITAGRPLVERHYEEHAGK
ncbi:unnamed protein product, partial [Laminaria digitata]